MNARYDSGFNWRDATWKGRIGLVALWALWCAFLYAALLVLSFADYGLARHDEQRTRCLHDATNGYDIQRCR